MATTPSFERPNIQKMQGYTPGEQPAHFESIVKLNTNENPYPPCNEVMEALRALLPENLRRYPPPDSKGFRKVAAQVHGVGEDQIIQTNGGDELLRLAITTFASVGGVIGMAEPSYTLYPVLADIHDARIHKVDLNADFTIPADFAKKMNAAGAEITFLVNPHAPSGLLTSPERLSEIAAELKGVLVIDEAYVDFVDPSLNHNTVPLLKKHPNVMLLRSCSKGYSLAGMRCGYGIGSAGIIAPMIQKTKDSYNMDIASQVVATASLTHRDKAKETWDKVRAERTRVVSELASMGLKTVPSQSNFVLATIPDSFCGGGESTYEYLKAHNVLIRYFKHPGLTDKIRITIGTPEENNTLLRNLREGANHKKQ